MRRRAPTMVGIVAALVLAGCATGERPYFDDGPSDPGTTTGDAAIDAVLLRLDAVSSDPPTFTAAYDVLRKAGVREDEAVVVVDGARRSVTVGQVHYIEEPGVATTCTVPSAAADGTCDDGIDPARISDTGVTIDFYASEPARRLRVDAVAAIGPTTTRLETIADQPAECIDVPQGPGTVVYCVLGNGVLARLDDGDVAITMTSFQAEADPVAFALPAD